MINQLEIPFARLKTIGKIRNGIREKYKFNLINIATSPTPPIQIQAETAHNTNNSLLIPYLNTLFFKAIQ